MGLDLLNVHACRRVRALSRATPCALAAEGGTIARAAKARRQHLAFVGLPHGLLVPYH
jgi:hypothetical protein